MRMRSFAVAAIAVVVSGAFLFAFKFFSSPCETAAASEASIGNQQHGVMKSIIASDNTITPTSEERLEPSEQASQPSSVLPGARARLDHSRNYKAFVHAALSNPSSEAIRVSLLAIERCAQLQVATNTRQNVANRSAEGNPWVNRMKERRADCEAGGGIDRQLERAVRTVAKTMASNGDKFLALALKPAPSADPLTKELIKLHGDTELALALGVTAIRAATERANIAPGLEKVPGELFSLAWAAEVCSRRQCDEVGLQSMQCELHQLCTQSSYSEQLTVLATTKLGVPIEVWQRLRSAMGAQIDALFANSPAS
jgi:hypothetical protein